MYMKVISKLDVAQAYSPSTWEAEARGLLQFNSSLGFIVGSWPAWGTVGVLVSKSKTNRKNRRKRKKERKEKTSHLMSCLSLHQRCFRTSYY